MTLLQSADEVRKLLRGFKAIEEVAAALEQVGQLERLAKEAETQRDGFAAEISSLKAQRDSLVDECKELVRKAKADAESIIRAASDDGDKIIKSAQEGYEQSVKKAQDDLNTVTASGQAARQELRTLNASIDAARAEFAGLEKKIEDARKKIAKMLEG